MIKKAFNYASTLLAMSGYVIEHATYKRTFVMLFSVLVVYALSYFQPFNIGVAITFFLFSTMAYLAYITYTLSEKGLRHWFVQRFGSEQEGYLAHQATLSLLFFHNGASISYVIASSPTDLLEFMPSMPLKVFAGLLFITGLLIKLWATRVTSVDIYYWKDMFLGRKISDFVQAGPYKYLSSPMYGMGQLTGYALALWHGSVIGLAVVVLNQVFMYTFYYLVERKFIARVYLSTLPATTHKV